MRTVGQMHRSVWRSYLPFLGIAIVFMPCCHTLAEFLGAGTNINEVIATNVDVDVVIGRVSVRGRG